jgi:hypothetical protein
VEYSVIVVTLNIITLKVQTRLFNFMTLKNIPNTKNQHYKKYYLNIENEEQGKQGIQKGNDKL